MSLVEDSLDETRNRTLIITKKSKNKQLEEQMLKKSCLDEKLTVRISPIEQLLDLDKVRKTVLRASYSLFSARNDGNRNSFARKSAASCSIDAFENENREISAAE